MKVAQAKRLLQKSSKAYYWLGFLLADGSISKKGQVKLRLAKTDKDHVQRFAKFIHYTGALGTIEIPSVAFQNTQLTAQFHKLGIVPNKTVNAITVLPNIESKLRLALIAGFIDGDGNIGYQTGRTDVKLGVKCYKTWLPFLTDCWKFLVTRYCVSIPPPKLNRLGYSQLLITNNVVIRKLYTELRRLHLPLLERKWNKIDCTRKSRYELARIDLLRARTLREQGLSNKAIITKMGITPYKLEAMMYRGKLLRRLIWLRQQEKLCA